MESPDTPAPILSPTLKEPKRHDMAVTPDSKNDFSREDSLRQNLFLLHSR